MVTSPELEAILASVRANPYSPNQSLEELRGNQLIPAAAAMPLPRGTSYAEVNAGNVPSEWTCSRSHSLAPLASRLVSRRADLLPAFRFTQQS